MLEITKRKLIRKTASENFEHSGISYVMTLSLFETLDPKHQLYELSRYPRWLKNNINVLLEPSIINMEDSLKFCRDNETANYKLDYIVSNLNNEDTSVVDYEKRKHVSLFASWASVVVLGEFDVSDIEEYIALEVEMQHKWFYVYCLEKNLPMDTTALKKSKIDILHLRSLIYEIELFEGLIEFFDDSSLPERIKLIQNGLIKTSNIIECLERYKHKLSFFKETLIFEGQMKQRKYSQTSELLLYFIAYIQIAPILFSLIKKYIYFEYIINSIILILFIFGGAVLILKNIRKPGDS